MVSISSSLRAWETLDPTIRSRTRNHYTIAVLRRTPSTAPDHYLTIVNLRKQFIRPKVCPSPLVKAAGFVFWRQWPRNKALLQHRLALPFTPPVYVHVWRIVCVDERMEPSHALCCRFHLFWGVCPPFFCTSTAQGPDDDALATGPSSA